MMPAPDSAAAWLALLTHPFWQDPARRADLQQVARRSARLTAETVWTGVPTAVVGLLLEVLHAQGQRQLTVGLALGPNTRAGRPGPLTVTIQEAGLGED